MSRAARDRWTGSVVPGRVSGGALRLPVTGGNGPLVHANLELSF